jgi:hypothetical protein
MASRENDKASVPTGLRQGLADVKDQGRISSTRSVMTRNASVRRRTRNDEFAVISVSKQCQTKRGKPSAKKQQGSEVTMRDSSRARACCADQGQRGAFARPEGKIGSVGRDLTTRTTPNVGLMHARTLLQGWRIRVPGPLPATALGPKEHSSNFTCQFGKATSEVSHRSSSHVPRDLHG